jgi:hypothetical protein
MVGANYRAGSCLNQDNLSLIPGLYSSLPWALTKDNYSIYWDVLPPHKKQGDGSKNERIVALKKLGLHHIPGMHRWSDERKRNYYRRYFATLYRAQPGLFKILEARIRFDNKYGVQSHPSQNDIAKIAHLSREWVNKGDQTLVDLGLITKLKTTNRKYANVYALGWWARDLILRRELSVYMPSLGAKLHSDFTPIIYNSNSKIILNLDSYSEMDGVQKYNLQVQDEQPDDMSDNEWRKVRGTKPQKAKGSERRLASGVMRERYLSVSSQKIEIKLGKRIMDKDLVAPRGLGSIMTNSPESAKLLVDKGSLAERNSAVDYYPTDEDAQPYKQSYQRPARPEQPRSDVRYVPAQYETLPQEKVNELRYAAIQNPEFQKAYETNLRLFGKEIADKMLEKVLDNIEKKEITPAHSVIVPRPA